MVTASMPRSCPKGTQAGIEHNDLGEGDECDASNNRYRALMDHYIWRNGLMVRDWRYGVRIANIDAAALTHDSRSEEHTSELQSLMRIAYAVICLKKKTRIRRKEPDKIHLTISNS